MAQGFNPKRLTLARRRRGLSKGVLAEEIQVSARTVTAYERGEKEPGPSNMAKLAHVLGFPAQFFHGPDLDEPPLEGSSFRALSNLTARHRNQALGSGALALSLSDWIDERFLLPEPDVPRLRGVDEETAAMAVRSQWGLGERPIRNMIHLLEAHGVRVFSLVEECRELDAFSFWRAGLPCLFLNTMKSSEHSRMDAAHELGHLTLHWNESRGGRQAEREADLFASSFLMPRGSILAEAPRGSQLRAIIAAKHKWNVSAVGLTYRMHKLGLLTEWQYRSLLIEMSRKGFRTSEPEGSQPETSQIFAKVFKTLRDEGMPMHKIASELCITPDELGRIVFGLVPIPVGGSDHPEAVSGEDRAVLHLV